jgi:hypothetical protein
MPECVCKAASPIINLLKLLLLQHELDELVICKSEVSIAERTRRYFSAQTYSQYGHHHPDQPP